MKIYEDYTDASGKFEIKLPTGTWHFRVSKSGWWGLLTISTTIVKGTNRRNVQLTQKLIGKVTGYAVFSNNIVISQIVASTISPEGVNQEYIELYNPTTWAWTISDATFDLKLHWKPPASYITDVSLVFVNTSIPENGEYYLIANTPTVIITGSSIKADAYFDSSAELDGFIKSNRAGAAIIADDYGLWIDTVG